MSFVSSRAQALLRGVVAPCCDVNNKMPQLHAAKSELID